MFVMWACGHAHPEDEDGRVQTCDPKPAWFIYEALRNFDCLPINGLVYGDYTLWVLNPIDQCYNAAQSCDSTVPLYIATRAGRRLMISPRGYNHWIPVLD